MTAKKPTTIVNYHETLHENEQLKVKIKELQRENRAAHTTFDLKHHGDEVIVSAGSNGKVKLAIKIQTGIQEHRSTLLTFDSQTQVERLLPAILKGLKS